jgi:hypothetical protein
VKCRKSADPCGALWPGKGREAVLPWVISCLAWTDGVTSKLPIHPFLDVLVLTILGRQVLQALPQHIFRHWAATVSLVRTFHLQLPVKIWLIHVIHVQVKHRESDGPRRAMGGSLCSESQISSSYNLMIHDRFMLDPCQVHAQTWT